MLKKKEKYTKKKNFWEELISYFTLKRQGPNRKRKKLRGKNRHTESPRASEPVGGVEVVRDSTFKGGQETLSPV
jgi:hypothetical protein